jgi:hypothetical protein
MVTDDESKAWLGRYREPVNPGQIWMRLGAVSRTSQSWPKVLASPMTDGFTVAGDHVARSEITHEASAIYHQSACLPWPSCSTKMKTKGLVGLVETLATAQLNLQHMLLLVSGLRCVCKKTNPKSLAGNNSAFNTPFN